MSGGRPTKRTDEAEEAILLALTAGNSRKVAAAAGGMHYDTLREWEKVDPEFSERLQRAEGFAQQTLLNRIWDAAQKGTTVTKKDGEIVEYPGAWQAAAWILERRWPQDYAGKTRVEMSGPDGAPIDHRDVGNDHEKELLAAAIRREQAARRTERQAAERTPDGAAVERPAEAQPNPTAG